MKTLISYFLRGLLVFVPIAVTLYIFWWVFTGLDGQFRKLFRLNVPGAGLLVTVALIIFVGFMASNLVGRKLLAFVDRIFNQLPLVKLLYGSVKDLVNAFTGEKKRFDKPVLVTLGSGLNAKVLGFVTRETLENFNLTDYVAVYLPQSYNWSGLVLLFPKQAVQPLDLPSADVMAFIISGGVAGKQSH
jgi:uncharacterized membrane protein